MQETQNEKSEIPSATTLRTQNDMRLDVATVASKTQNYPAEIIEPVQWLAGFVREHCSGRLDLLLDRVKQHGFKEATRNYFYKILTGRYFERRTDGTLAGSVANLAQIIDRLRAGVLLAERAGKTPFIETPTYFRIRDLLDLKRSPETVCKFAVIIGPTGGQKTESAKHYCHLNNSGKCVHVEAPERPTLGTFITDLAFRYGHSVWSNSEIKKRNIALSVDDRKLIVVDNVQRLWIKGAGGNQPIFSYLQKLQDDTGCAIALMFAEDRANFLLEGLEAGFFEQFEGRAGGRENFLVLDKYTPREDLIAIATAYGVAGDLTSPKSPVIAYLEKLSKRPGRIRILFDALQRARREADQRTKAGGRVCELTIGLIREVRGEVED